MRAVRFHEHGGPEVLTVDGIERPTPGNGELLVEVEAGDCAEFAVGDRVFATALGNWLQGTCAEYAVVPNGHAAPRSWHGHRKRSGAIPTVHTIETHQISDTLRVL